MNGIRVIPQKYFRILLPVLAFIVLATMPHYLPPYGVVVLGNVFMYTVLAVSWNVFCAPTNYLSLATAAFFGVGVYTSAIFQELPWPLVILIAGSLSFLVGLMVGAITLRLRGMYFAIFTFGLSELFRHGMVWYESNITRTVGRWLPAETSETVYYYMLALLAITLLATYIIRRSKFGPALHSIGQNEEAAAHLGINVNAVKIITFAITCFFMGAAGAIMAKRWSYIDPSLAFDPFRTFYVIIMVLLGGMGSIIYGPISGAIVITLLSDVALVDYPRQTMLLFGIILVAVITFLPNGLMGIVERIRRGKKVTAPSG
jgi:branched-chain amino acid transport system permease protein